MSNPTVWQEFFDAHAPIYEENVFTKNTAKEVDFLIEELGLPLGASILDVGCGTGRHSIELAKRGYAVTGLDLSDGMLAQAAEASKAAGVNVEWIRADATRFSLPRRYDAAVCLCEGSFGLLAQGDDPIQCNRLGQTSCLSVFRPQAGSLDQAQYRSIQPDDGPIELRQTTHGEDG